MARTPKLAPAPPSPFTLAGIAPGDLARRLAEYDGLARCAAEPNPFYESWYLLPSLTLLDRQTGVEVLILECEGRLAGLFPVLRAPRYYGKPLPHLRNWVHPNCFLGAPLVAAGCEQAFWQALLAWADAQAAGALFLHLDQIPLEGPLHEALQRVLAQQRRKAGIVQREDRAMLQSDLSPQAYFDAALSAKKRKELRRQLTRLGELGTVTFDRQDDKQGLPEWIDAFLALESSGWKGKAGSALASRQQTESLFRQAMAGAAVRGRLERLTLSLDAKPIAMLATFVTAPGAFSYKTAFDEAFARFSPGVLLQRENLAMLQRAGTAWTDSCAAADHPMIDHIWRERRAVGRISVAIGGKLRRAIFGALLGLETRPPRR